MSEVGPVYKSIQKKLSEALNPTSLEIINESHLHAHHQAMKDVTSKETHFRLIYGLLDEEMSTGVHALTIKAKTPKEFSTRLTS
ncbi:6676_t:CDS:2 [Funneliformis geosporum]|uniref:8516_t:CDS:1 n=1 Tax=Funneliformis geosporum TaxID=1117311 RepID=A0A9W4SB62_9GLOM|nr:6676_t:CDS:2 [Funneliformis geosporum]CAI2162450.1 8516_t:CDS:2 [Funneliformis geosporum]